MIVGVNCVFGPSLGWSEKIFYLEDVGMCWNENVHFEHLSRLRQTKSKSGVKGWGWEGVAGGGGGVRERRRERKLLEPRLLHFAPYFNYPSCHFNDQSELGVRFYA